MPDSLTITGLARAIANQDGLDDAAEAKVHRQIRNFISQGVIDKGTPDDSDGRGTQNLPLAIACVVRLLVPMSRQAVDARGLRKAATAMCGLAPNGSQTWIDRAIQSVRVGRAVEFIVDGYPDGENAYFRFDDEPKGKHSQQILDDYRQATQPPQTRLIIAVSSLLRPLLTTD